MSNHFSLIEHLSESGCTCSLFHISFIILIADFVPLGASHILQENTIMLDIENFEEF